MTRIGVSIVAVFSGLAVFGASAAVAVGDQQDVAVKQFSRVETRGDSTVYDSPLANAGVIGKQAAGVRGTIIDGSGDVLWQVDFDEGPDGWCRADEFVDRTPKLPTFSLEGCFRDVHSPCAKTLTLGEDGVQTLEDAIAALRPDGGVILVPPGTYENQNSRLGKRSMSVTLRGILGSDGERPKFLFKGPKPSGLFMSFGVSAWTKLKEGIAAPPNLDQALVENLEIGGYGAAISIGNCARFVMKNCIVHDSPNNLIASANLAGTQRCSLEFYGNEIFHGGQGNHKHNFYLHRGHDDAFVRIVFINNYCHSARGSSALKSIANEHIIVGNLFESASSGELDKQKYSSTLLVDVPAASDNLIVYNTFNYRGESASRSAIGIRRRASIYGCDRPPYLSREFHSPNFWTAVAGRRTECDLPNPKAVGNPFFIHAFIYGNTFRYVGTEAKRAPAIITWGTVPWVTSVSFGPKLPLRRPVGWLERSRLWVANNRYHDVPERHRDLAASPNSFATKEALEKNKRRWLREANADALKPYLDWTQSAPPKVATIVPVGGEDGNPIPVPAWFPQVNLDELPASIKTHWPSRPHPAWP